MSRAAPQASHSAFLHQAESSALRSLAAMAEGSNADAWGELELWLEQAGPELPLQRIAEGFTLDPPATALLSLLFAASLSEPVARGIAAAAPSGGRGVPLWVALRLIPGLTAGDFAASAPLRRFGLVEMEGDVLRVEAALRLADPLVDRLCGLVAVEPLVSARILPVPVRPELADSGLAAQIGAALASRAAGALPPVILAGLLEVDMLAAALAEIGLRPFFLPGAAVPEEPDLRDALARRWSREAALDGAALIVAADERNAPAAADLADRIMGHVLIAGRMPASAFLRPVRAIGAQDVGVARPEERWLRALGPDRSKKLGSAVRRIAAQFRLDPAEIDAVCARTAAALDAASPEVAGGLLWHEAGRASLPAPVPGVAIVEPRYGWADIVLPPAVEGALRRVESHVRHATTVLDDWGFAERMGGRGRGVTALFSGPSGTGKTMAAEVLATSLDLRMMLIDLSQIISKYVGETSKNVAAAFEQAERLGAVMVWNEGDAIWGSRGTVGNATDRHVNAEIGDLLERMEAFRGFTVVTTNMRHAIDTAFLRRFRFTLDFPMPSEAERLRLWRLAFPARAPLDPVDWTALAKLPLNGGSIRNIALGSAFLAAENGTRIGRELISLELAEELRKHNQPMPMIDWGTEQ